MRLYRIAVGIDPTDPAARPGEAPMGSKKESLVGIVGAENVLDDAGTLEAWSKDESFAPHRRPWFVVRPRNAAQVQALVAWANATATPLVPVSSGGPHFLGDTVPSVPEAVIVDLSGMNAILKVDARNRIAVIEPGVTYAQLDAALAEKGLRIARPLAPRATKSVVASLLERTPTVIPRLNYNLPEPLRTCGVVWGTGEVAFTGEAGYGPKSLEDQWKRGASQVDPKGPNATDLMRIVTGAQGSMGIVIWASVRLDVAPTVHEYTFVPGRTLDELAGFWQKLTRTRLGDEVAVLNAAQLAQLVGKDAAAVDALKAGLPPYVVVIGLGGAALFPEERVAVARKDLDAIVTGCGLTRVASLPGVSPSDVAAVFEGCSAAPHWKVRYRGASQQVFFLSKIEKVSALVATVQAAAEANGVPAGEVGVYVQPQHQGVVQHVELTLPYDPGNARQTSWMKAAVGKASRDAMEAGAYFSRPYGEWADMVYARDADAKHVLRTVKGIVDPKNVLNPGKLCF